VILVLPVLGAAALSRATFGVRTGWALGAALVTCNALFLLGFLNFGLAVGLAMLAAAGWFRFRETWPVATVLLSAVAACVLFFCHLAGVVFFLLMIGACEIERCWDARGAGRVRALLGRAAAGLVVVVAPAGLYLATSLSDTGGIVQFASWRVKGLLALYPVVNYSFWVDLGTAMLVVGVLVVLVVSGRMQVPVRWRIVIGVLAVLFAVMPQILKGLAYVDSRFSVLLWFAVFSGMRPVRLSRGAAVGLCVAGALLLLGRTALVGTMWHAYGAEVADVRAVVQPIEPGARVLPVWLGEDKATTGPVPRLLSDGTAVDWHLPAMVMLDRRAFWPYFFAIPGQQPVRWVGDYNGLSRDTQAAVFARYVSGAPLSATDKAAFPLWATWPSLYDYVLLIQEGGTPVDPAGFGAGQLELLRQAPLAALFRVRPGSSHGG
jgi:hypothetical protein